MKPYIKICGMLDPENIKAVAGLKPDYMGFIFYRRSPRFAGDTLKPEVLSEIPPEIIKTGVFVNAEFTEISETVRKYSLNCVQLHGTEPPGLCRRIKETGIRVIKAFNIMEKMSNLMYNDFLSSTDYFLFDAKTMSWGGSGQKFNWKLLDTYDSSHPFFLSGGISPSDEPDITAIRNSGFYGIDLNSRFEIVPGIKDIDKLQKFISHLRLNDNIL